MTDLRRPVRTDYRTTSEWLDALEVYVIKRNERLRNARADVADEVIAELTVDPDSTVPGTLEETDEPVGPFVQIPGSGLPPAITAPESVTAPPPPAVS